MSWCVLGCPPVFWGRPGVIRLTAHSTNGKPNIDEKISLGRKTAYSLMGAGFHGGGGLKPSQNGDIWSTFIVPRLLYGLEALLLNKKDIDCLERFQRRCLKQIQGLPDKTSNSISLALLGFCLWRQYYTKML